MGLFSLARKRDERKFKGGMRDCKGSAGSGKLVVFMAREFLSFWGGKRDGRPPTPEVVATWKKASSVRWWWHSQQTVTESHPSANFSNPLVYAQNSTTLSMSVIRKQVISRFLQRLITRPDFCKLLMHSTQHFLSTKSTTSIVCAIYRWLLPVCSRGECVIHQEHGVHPTTDS